MKTKSLVREYFLAWRTVLYFTGFCVLLSVLLLPMQLLAMIEATRYPVLHKALLAVLLLVYLPYALHLASKMSGVGPPTPDEEERRQREVVARKNAELERESGSGRPSKIHGVKASGG